MPVPSPSLTRRTLLAGAAGAAGLALLAACGSSGDDSGDDGAGDGSGDDTAGGGVNLFAVFPLQGLLVTGAPQRLPFTLAGTDGAPLDDGPATLDFVVTDEDGNAVGDPITVDRHDQGIPTAYYPLIVEFPATGTYQATTTIDGEELEPRAFAVVDPSEVSVPQPGQPMIPVDTPTTDDARRVDPICTRDPECDLHGETLTAALATGKPVALAIATPAYCQTAICGPVLDVLLSQQADFPDIAMVHAEVYKDPEAVDNIADAELTPVIDAYQLSYEPALFLANSDGTIATRLDTIFDEVEVRDALAQLT